MTRGGIGMSQGTGLARPPIPRDEGSMGKGSASSQPSPGPKTCSGSTHPLLISFYPWPPARQATSYYTKGLIRRSIVVGPSLWISRDFSTSSTT